LIRNEFLWGGTRGKTAEAKLDEFEELDADDSGAMDFQEFLKWEPFRATPEGIAKEFKRLDTDADGKVPGMQTVRRSVMGRRC